MKVNKEDTIKCFLNCKGEDNGFQLTLTNKDIDVIANEIERLNNIINELEKWLNEKICLNKNDKDYANGMTFVGVNLQMYQMFLNKLQELKGSNSNENL